MAAAILVGPGCSGKKGPEPGDPTPPPYTCGDSVQETGEQCDDGNVAAGDGCDASCRLEITPEITAPTRVLGQSDCGSSFTDANTRYELSEDITCPGTAFTFGASEIVFDGGGYTIVYGAAGGTDPGIDVVEWNRRNIVLTDFRLEQHPAATGGAGIRASQEPTRLQISQVEIEGGEAIADWHSISAAGANDAQLLGLVLYSHSPATTNRHAFSGTNISFQGKNVLVDRVIAVGGSQNAMVVYDGAIITNSYFASGGVQADGTAIAKVTNDFALTGWQTERAEIANCMVINTHRNVIQEQIGDYMKLTGGVKTIDDLLAHHADMSDPDKQPIALIPFQEGRGIGFGGDVPSTGIVIRNSVVFTENSATNEEYGGCTLGGAYGIQLENFTDSRITNTRVTANAYECEAHAFRVGGWVDVSFAGTTVENNLFHAVRVEGGAADAYVFKFSAGVELSLVDNRAVLQGSARLLQMDGPAVDGLSFVGTRFDTSRYTADADRRLFVCRVWDESQPDPTVPAPTEISFVGSAFEDAATETLLRDNSDVWRGWGDTAGWTVLPEVTIRISR